MEPFLTLFNFPQFQAGLHVGLVAAVLVALAGLLLRNGRRARRRPPLGMAGPGLVIASLVVLGGSWGSDEIVGLPTGLLQGLALLIVGGEIASRTRWPLGAGLVLAVPGAWMLADSYSFPGPGWSRWLVFGVAVLGSPMAADLDRRLARLGLGPVLFALSALGLYTTVPDTELSRAILGVALPMAVVGWPLRLARLGAGGAAAAVGLLVWVAAIDGYGRPGSMIGAAGAIALLLTEPIGRRFRRRTIVGLARATSIGSFEIAVVVAQFTLVFYASRVAGFAQDALPALFLLVPAIAVSISVGIWFGISSRLRPGRRRHRSGKETPGSPSPGTPLAPTPEARETSAHPSRRRRRPRSSRPSNPGLTPPHPN
ncbi:MAG: hypothetical protein EXQ69_02060 [Acidimicrobiia bacterium]|nr:hypothetical protein [Acidimicrobiia bacterium]